MSLSFTTLISCQLQLICTAGGVLATCYWPASENQAEPLFSRITDPAILQQPDANQRKVPTLCYPS